MSPIDATRALIGRVLVLMTLNPFERVAVSLKLVSMLLHYSYTYTYTYTYCYLYCIMVLTKLAPAWVPIKASFSTSDTIVTLYRHRSTNQCVSLFCPQTFGVFLATAGYLGTVHQFLFLDLAKSWHDVCVETFGVLRAQHCRNCGYVDITRTDCGTIIKPWRNHRFDAESEMAREIKRRGVMLRTNMITWGGNRVRILQFRLVDHLATSTLSHGYP